MREPNKRLEDWIDGQLHGSELREFEERLTADPRLGEESEFARRVEASLKRTFATGDGAPIGARRVAQALRDTAAPRELTRMGAWVLGACAALAAAYLVFIRVLPSNGPEADANRIAVVDPGGTREVSLELPARVRPDLEDIYCSAKEYAARQDWTCSPAETRSMRVGDLIADHGESIGLWPDAALDLEGPILSPEWPGSMIFAGGEAGEMALLIAERDAVNTCCLDIELPESSDLRLHSWRVGEVLWFELSPFDQPRFLPRLASDLQ